MASFGNVLGEVVVASIYGLGGKGFQFAGDFVIHYLKEFSLCPLRAKMCRGALDVVH